MGNSKKDEAKIEKIIRGLLKLPENRRCINCNLLGPQYVCTTFCTFVCTNCSGIHREFTHRVKSVSMAKFTLEEVEAIQAGGNERAKEIYFKCWDPQRHSYPESNNMQRLREFIKNVYVERKFTGEHHVDLPRIREEGKEEPYQSKKINLFRIEPKSPSYEARVQRSSSARSPDIRSDDNNNVRFYVDERRSPRYAQNLARHGSFARKPIQIEVVDNRFRDGESRNSKVTDLDTKLKQLQPARQKTVDESQLPVVRPLGEVSGENGPSLKASNAASVPEMQSISQPIEENWAIFEDFPVANAAENKISNTNIFTSSVTMTTPQATHTNSLDFLLSELSGPLVATTGDMSTVSTFNNDLTIVPVENSSTHGDLQHLPPFPISEATASPTSSDAWSIIPIQANEMEQPSNALPSNDEINHREESNKVLDWQTSPSMQFSPAVSVGSSSTAQPTSTPITPIAPNDMQSDVLNSHDPSSAFTELSPQTNSKPTQETKSGVGLKPSTVENRSTGRMELPEDLFSSSYLSGPPTPLSGWQNDQPQHHGMGYGLQYYPNAPSPSAFPIAARSSSNPFAATEDKPLAHTLSLPNMSCTLPVSPGAGLMHASSYGSSGMVPQSTSFGSPLVHPQSASGFPNSAYFGQVNNMQPPRFERAASTSDDESVFGSLSTMKLSSGEYMTQTTPNPFSKKGRNPFGDI
ncbi:hypothetical protein HN51_045575 [Arachis hypogaea]|uniref:Arf-GAP domain-containing protein n=2 Tax=Arachis hypogaea TaxID=3818 RepID=A0A444XYB0_ARAHY|nr:uncharacterized protein LOC107614533 isoform X1 [Arachis ipaensis]XP_020965642.1 uncharacterized protein LOC107614533 isoform X1 [Arachis ipaensis]XP_025670634.1 uncharacterized protein LOC112770501 isoform X1 [Arachis hypogaea]XP_029150845.1 uncharacterized protein LOC112770501 isoform X1 [Arachis hypogaea]QHN97848.1 putative ADP-ribosylation factor GTPase-activating protein [Arachis hypogaea]QHN97849.1 putative ADP-ribosylation factor GTPase-activating protein [Arachis hypogaea]RYQ94639.